VAEQGPESAAGGLPAVTSALGIAAREMGPIRALKTLPLINQRKGFDCPGCAWPESDQRHLAEFCENGAKAVAWEATRKRVDGDFFAAHSLADLETRDDHWLESQGRLVEPMFKAAGDTHYRPISWDAALDRVAEQLRGLASPNEAIFYTSGRTSNEAAFLYQLFVRRFGTNNLPDCSNMCHESSTIALTSTIGIGKSTVSLVDITDHADLIVVVGQNPGTNHPRMLSALETAKRRGARVVSINPLPEAGLMRFRNPQRASGMLLSGTAIADLDLPIRVNGDHAFFTLVNRRLVEREERDGGVLDQAFIDEQCEGLENARAGWLAADVESLHAICGLDAAQVEAFVDETVNADRVIVCWAMGLTQHRNSVSTIREIVNYVLLRGNVGRPGAGACPVRGHSNVQGDRTMGIYEKPTQVFLDALGKAFDFSPPREHGYDVVESIRALRDGQVRVMMAVGGNFAAATPDTEVTYAALRNATLTVQVSTKLNRSHVVTGNEALILPCLGRTDIDEQATGPQFVTVEDSMCAVHASRGHLKPISAELRSEAWIVANLAHRVLGPDDSVDWIGLSSDYSRVRDAIEQVIPGFTNFNERIGDGFVLPNAPRDSRTFPTASGKAVFTSAAVEAVEVPPGHLMLQTMRSHDQYNTTIYGLDDRYRGIKGERRVVFVHPDDLTEFGIADGAVVDLVSISLDGERRAANFLAVGYPTPRGCAAAYFPEANALVPLDSVATESGTPTSKSIVVRLVVSTV